jgi:histidinol phosphatase-like enzyme
LAVIAVDFDHTLFTETPSGEAVPLPHAREAMVELKRQGHHLVIHTCRTTVAREDGNLADELQWIAATLNEHGIPFDEIYAGDKLIADAYVDDRAVGFRGDWNATLSELGQRLRRRKSS